MCPSRLLLGSAHYRDEQRNDRDHDLDEHHSALQIGRATSEIAQFAYFTRTVSLTNEITREDITLLIMNLKHDNNTFDKSVMSHVKSIEETVKAHEVTIKNLDTSRIRPK